MKTLIVGLLILSASFASFAHEGHGDAPGSLKANHGGTVKSGKEINLEYVVSGSQLKVYPANHDGTDLLATDIKVSGTAKLPKGKPEVVKFEIKDGAYTAQVDFKNAYRIEMLVSTEFKGKKDTFKFQVEK